MTREIVDILLIEAGSDKRGEASLGQGEQSDQWAIDANACYRDAVGNVMALSIAGLTLPVILATALLPDSPSTQAVFCHLGLNLPTALAAASMALFLCAIACGMSYFHASAEWVKRAHGRRNSTKYQDIPDKPLEKRLDRLFQASIWLSILGVILAIGFGLFFSPACQAG